MNKLLKKWQVWIPIVVGLLTIVTMTFDLPIKIKDAFGNESLLVLSGVIRDESNKPLSGVTVKLQELGLAATTNQDGKFQFQITAAKQESQHLVAQKDGYEICSRDIKWENTRLEFTMQSKTKLLKKWQTWVAIVVAVLTVPNIILDLRLKGLPRL